MKKLKALGYIIYFVDEDAKLKDIVVTKEVWGNRVGFDPEYKSKGFKGLTEGALVDDFKDTLNRFIKQL